MIAPPTRRVDQPSCDPRDKKSIRDPELDSVVDRLFVFGQNGVELRSLGYSSREAVKDEAVMAVRGVGTVFDDEGECWDWD